MSPIGIAFCIVFTLLMLVSVIGPKIERRLEQQQQED